MIEAIKDDSQTMQSVQVEIYNQVYNIRFDGDSDYVVRLAEYIDERMREIAATTRTADSLKVAVLTALHITDELYQLKTQLEQTDNQLATRSAKCAEMLDKFLKQSESNF